MNDLLKIIKEEINEVFDSKTETTYQTSNKVVNGYQTQIFTFKTKSNTEYDLYFLYLDDVNIEQITINDDLLLNYLNVDNNYNIKIINIGFSLSNNEKNQKDIDLDLNNFDKNSNLHEQYELFSRISYLIDIYLNNNKDVDLYVAFNNLNLNRLNIYKQIYKNLFSDYNYKLFYGDIKDFNIYNALLFINEKILD